MKKNTTIGIAMSTTILTSIPTGMIMKRTTTNIATPIAMITIMHTVMNKGTMIINMRMEKSMVNMNTFTKIMTRKITGIPIRVSEFYYTWNNFDFNFFISTISAAKEVDFLISEY